MMDIGATDKRYIQLRNEKEEIESKLGDIEKERRAAWKTLESDYPFQRAVPEAFFKEQEQMGRRWESSLIAQSDELNAYADRIQNLWQDKSIPEEERKQLARKELQEMLNFARSNLDIRDANGKPVTGKLELRDFGPGVTAGGMTNGSDISINERLIFEGENVALTRF